MATARWTSREVIALRNKKTPLWRGFFIACFMLCTVSFDPHPDEARRAVSKDRPSRLRFAPHLRVRGVALDKEVRRAAIKKARGLIEILVMTRRKWCFSRTGAECTLGYMSTGSEEKRHLQAVSA